MCHNWNCMFCLATDSWNDLKTSLKLCCKFWITTPPPFPCTATAKSLQSCPTLCDPIEGSPPGWDSPGKNTGVGCHFPLRCVKVKSEREVTQSCPTLSDPMDFSLPGSSVHGIFQARVLEWGAIVTKVFYPHLKKTELQLECLTISSNPPWRRQWHPTPVLLPGESQGRGSLVGCRLWGCTESDMTEVT